jgi:hypothetical protein
MNNIIGKAMAGHFLDGDAGGVGRNHPKYDKRYANPLSDWIALVIAEAKLLPDIDVNALHAETLRRHAKIDERNRRRSEISHDAKT